MKLVIQRALAGSVIVDGNVVGETKNGAVCLVGIHRDDKEEDLDWMVQKLLGFCLWDSETGEPWARNIKDIDGELLLVSQFTLHARVGSGRRPDFSRSMGSEHANEVFERFVDKVKANYKPEKIQTGLFGAMMHVHIVNDGPVTFTFDSFNKKE